MPADFKTKDKFDPSKGFTDVIFGADTELLEVELNEMQKIQREASASLMRNTVHSGFLTTSDLNYLTTPLNSVSFKTEQKVNVNGYEVTIPAGTVVTLVEPPTEGSRDDLVFLEAWLEEITADKDASLKDARMGVETSRRTKLNWRIRTMADVNFAAYPQGLGTSYIAGATQAQVFGQGGKDTPYVGTGAIQFGFKWSGNENVPNRANITSGLKKFNDVGIFVSGEGNSLTKDGLATTDGYSYAVPMFRVKRRNSGGYSVSNGNGAREYYRTFNVPFIATIQGEIGKEVAVTTTTDVTGLKVGDRLLSSSNLSQIAVITAVTGARNFVVKMTTTFTQAGAFFETVSDRPNGKFSNIIDATDVIDLRHQVSLTGYNYKQLLEENFDKLLRGELQTKERTKMVKTYHGIRKTPIDSNTILYASLDGTNVAEVGGAPKNSGVSASSFKYTPTPTGTGITSANNHYVTYEIPYHDTLTIDFVYKIKPLLILGDANGQKLLVQASDVQFIRSYASPFTGGWNSQTFGKGMPVDDKFHHYRLVVNIPGRRAQAYIDGESIGIVGINSFTGDLSKLTVQFGHINVNSYSPASGNTVSDISISKIDRGANFATLPKDFIDGYARITSAFNNQRRNLSDAQIAQATVAWANPKSQISSRGLTITKGAGVNATIWEPGDKIAVKGLTGEFISNTTPPTVKASVNGTTTINVVGTWTGLDTNVATFTLGTNVDLDTEEILLEYTLLTPGGEGGVPEVLTEVLAGEWNGKKLVKGTPSLKADFRGKVAGSLVENPHTMKYASADTLLPPTDGGWTELVNGNVFNGYGNISAVDGKLVTVGNTVTNGRRAMHFKTFDLIAHVERNHRRIPGLTVADKVTWLKANITVIRAHYTGVGSGAVSSKVTITPWTDNHTWGIYPNYNSAEVVTRTTITVGTPSRIMSAEGYVYIIAYAEPSDGIIPSAVSSDHIELEIEFKVPTGYDALTPEDPYSDGTKKGFLLVRKETKEIETYTDADENTGIVTYGNYVPYQGSPLGTLIATAYTPKTAYVTSAGSGKTYSVASPYSNMLQRLPLPKVSDGYSTTGMLLSAYTGTFTSTEKETSATFILPIATTGGFYKGFSHKASSNSQLVEYSLLDDEVKARTSSRDVMAIHANLVLTADEELVIKVLVTNLSNQGTLLNYIGETGALTAKSMYKLIGNPIVKGVN